MKKWHWFISINISLILFFVSSFVFAGNKPCMTTFTLGGGYYRFPAKRHIDNTEVGFGELAYNFTQQLGIEGLLGFFTTDSRRDNENGRTVDGTLFAIDAIYRFPSIRCFEPYVLAGPGILSMNPNGNDPNTEGNVNAGIGTQIFISEIVAFRFELRDFYTIVGGKNDVFLNGGVSFLF